MCIAGKPVSGVVRYLGVSAGTVIIALRQHEILAKVRSALLGRISMK